MFRSILVPLDGSPFGEQALPLALDLARRAKITLHLTQVLLPIGSLAPEGPLAGDTVLSRRLAEQQKAAQQGYLDDVARRLTNAGAPRVQTWLLDGNIPGMIREQVERVGSDLVVMSTHGRGSFARFWLGSVADELVRSLHVPMVLIRPGEEPADLAKAPTLKHILLPLDGSTLSEQMVKPAIELGLLTEAEITLVRVVRPVPLPVYAIEGQTLGEMVDDVVKHTEEQLALNRVVAEKQLNRVAAAVRDSGLRARTRVQVDESPAAALLRDAHSVDLIALATHGRKGLSRLFVGSVADKLIRGAPVPVLVYRPKEA